MLGIIQGGVGLLWGCMGSGNAEGGCGEREKGMMKKGLDAITEANGRLRGISFCLVCSTSAGLLPPSPLPAAKMTIGMKPSLIPKKNRRMIYEYLFKGKDRYAF